MAARAPRRCRAPRHPVWCNKEAEARVVAGRSAAHVPCRDLHPSPVSGGPRADPLSHRQMMILSRGLVGWPRTDVWSAASEHAPVLARIEAEYGVPRRVILAIWGMESQFGWITGGVPVFQALATLAWDPRRAEFFRGEIVKALSIVANGDITVAGMTGSWAGAMGRGQCLPSSYLQLAVDADGDGRRDIWASTADALGSIANYLRGIVKVNRLEPGRKAS